MEMITENIAIEIGKAYLDLHGGRLIEAFKMANEAGAEAGRDVLIAYIHRSDPELAERLAAAVQ